VTHSDRRSTLLALTAAAVAFCALFFDFVILRKYFTGADFVRLIVPFYNFQSDCDPRQMLIQCQ
jgi:hypothetical protein